MPDSDQSQNGLARIASNPRYLPTAVCLTCFLGILLFIRDIPDNVKSYLLASTMLLSVYFGVIGSIANQWYYENCYTGTKQLSYKLYSYQKSILYASYFLALALDLFYLWHRKVL